MKQSKKQTISLVAVIAVLVGILLILEAIVWNSMTVTYRAVLVTKNEKGEIVTEQELPDSLLDHGGTQYLSLGGETNAVTAKNGYGYRFLGWSDGKQDLTRRDRTVSNLTFLAYFEYDTGSLSYLSYAENTLTVIDPSLKEESLHGVLTKVADKKEYSAYKHTYTLAFAEEVELLGMQAREWLLAPVYEDPTLLRDYFAYQFASFIDGSPKCELVTLMNEYEYAGVYLLSPKFLPEGQWAMEYSVQEDLSYETLDTMEYGLESFSYGTLLEHKIKINKQQVSFIKGTVLSQIYDLVFSNGEKEAVSARIELDSAVDLYIVTELTKNTMAGRRGTFMMYEAGKIKFLSETYFSLSAGLDKRNASATGSVYDQLVCGDGTSLGAPIYLLAGFSKLDWFKDLVCQRWQKIGEQAFTNAYFYVEQVYERAKNALQNDKIIYPCYSSTNDLRVEEWEYYVPEIKTNSFEENVRTFFSWLKDRKAYMDQTYGVNT